MIAPGKIAASLLLALAPAVAAAGQSVRHDAQGALGDYARACVARITRQTSDEWLRYHGPGLDTRARPVVTMGIVVDRDGRILDASVIERFDGSEYGDYAREAIARVASCGGKPPLPQAEPSLTIVVSFGSGLEGNRLFDPPPTPSPHP